jgi:allantoate deiminase
VKTDPLAAATALLVKRLDELGRISDEKGRLTRTFFSPAMRRANALVASWMREAGLSVREDVVGNVIGRLDPCRAGSPDPAVPSLASQTGGVRKPRPTTARTLLLGSHLDTVRNAGRFDGALGVLLPIVVLSVLRRRGVSLPFAVEVLGFSEEEAVRFPTAYIGSKAYTGRLRGSELAVRDAAGGSLRDVIAARAGKTFTAPKPIRASRDLLGYLEVHIEQGPVLEAEKLAVGVVSAIASQTRGRFVFRGKAGHAGTTPMALRRDALTGAAEFVQTVEKFARQRSPLVATVGVIEVPAGATNVIPGETALSLDVRHPNDAACRRAVKALVAHATAIARRRGLRVEWQQTMQHAATVCSAELNRALSRSVKKIQRSCPALVSGAGHDAVAMSEVAPVAMLFVRCRDGLSHHPDEYASPADLRVALAVMIDFLEQFAAAPT